MIGVLKWDRARSAPLGGAEASSRRVALIVARPARHLLWRHEAFLYQVADAWDQQSIDA